MENWLAQKRWGSGTAGRPVDREEMQRHGLKIHKNFQKPFLVIKFEEISKNPILDMNFDSDKFIKRGDDQQILRGYFNLK